MVGNKDRFPTSGCCCSKPLKVRTWPWDGERLGAGEAGQGSRHRLEKAEFAAERLSEGCGH